MKNLDTSSSHETPRDPNTPHTDKAHRIDILVGGKVKLRRQELGLSQGKLATHLGVTFQQIQKYESGTNRIGASRLLDLSLALHVPIEYFYQSIPSLSDLGPGQTPDQTEQMSGQVIAMNKSFVRISSPTTRAHIIELVQGIASSQDVRR
jgi:transcriptional regulator with XRE-family HTH domain